MAVNLNHPYLIVTQWGKGFICVQESHTERSLAMRRLHTLSSNHYKKHYKNITPTFYLFSREAFMKTEPRVSARTTRVKVTPKIVNIGHGG